MSIKKNKNFTEESMEGVESVLSKSEKYIEENQKSLTIIILAIFIIVGIYLGFNKLYVAPLEKEAQSQMFYAEQYFEKDSFDLAVNGDGNYFGFLDIIDEYGITNSGNLAYYYAGISYLNMEDYENAIEYLKQFDSNDELISCVAYGAIGDSYVGLEELSEAISFYIKAASNKNKFTTPIYYMKAGTLYEELGDYKNALKLYKKIKKAYPKTIEGKDIEKYITRATIKSNN